MKTLHLCGLALAIASISCSHDNLIFATRSSVGVEVAGDQTPLPDHVNFGYRRREFIVAGDKVSTRMLMPTSDRQLAVITRPSKKLGLTCGQSLDGPR